MERSVVPPLSAVASWKPQLSIEDRIEQVWIVKVSAVRKSNGMVSPLAHGSRADNAGGPQDETLQALGASNQTVATIQASTLCAVEWQGSQNGLVLQGVFMARDIRTLPISHSC